MQVQSEIESDEQTDMSESHVKVRFQSLVFILRIHGHDVI